MPKREQKTVVSIHDFPTDVLVQLREWMTETKRGVSTSNPSVVKVAACEFARGLKDEKEAAATKSD